MLLPVVAGRVEPVVDVLPRRGQGLLEEDAHVASLVGGLDLPAEVDGQRGKQRIGARSRAHDVHDDGGQRHRPGQ